jgi:hypothetical protein
MTDQTPDVAAADPDAPDHLADYDPDEDQDTEPSTMAPPGEGPTAPQDT